MKKITQTAVLRLHRYTNAIAKITFTLIDYVVTYKP